MTPARFSRWFAEVVRPVREGDRPVTALDGLFMVCVAFYATFTLLTMSSPPLMSEEASEGVMVSNILSGTYYPLGYNDYVGALHYYLMALFVAAGGMNLVMLRLYAVCLAALLVVVIYRFLRANFGGELAKCVITLVSTSVLFVQCGKQQYFSQYVIFLLLLWAAMYALLTFEATHRPLFLCLAGLLAGLGLHEKINFLYYLAGMGLYVLIRWRRYTAALRRAHWFLAAAACFLGGYSLTIAYNIREGGRTYKLLFGLLTGHQTYAGVDNADYWRNFSVRIGQFMNFLRRDIGLTFQWGVARIPPVLAASSRLMPYFVALCFLGLVWFLVTHRGFSTREREALLLFGCVWGVTFLGLPFTPSALQSTHMFMMFPVAEIVTGSFLAALLRVHGARRWVRAAVHGTLLALVVTSLSLNVVYYREMRRTGGLSTAWSEATYDVADYLTVHGARRVFASNWGTHKLVEFLTQGRIVPLWYNPVARGALFFSTEVTPDDRLNYILQDPEVLDRPMYFLWSLEDPLSEEGLQKVAALKGKKLRRVRYFQNRLGETLYSLYEIS